MWCIELAYLAVRIKHFLEKTGGKQNNAGFTLPGVSKLSARFFMRVLSQVRTEGYYDLPHWKLRDGQFLLQYKTTTISNASRYSVIEMTVRLYWEVGIIPTTTTAWGELQQYIYTIHVGVMGS